MLFNVVLSTLILIGMLGPVAGPGAPPKLESVLAGYYGSDARLSPVTVSLTEKQKSEVSSLCGRAFGNTFPSVWRIEQNKNGIGYVFTDDAKGKVKTITYAVFFTNEGSIRGVEILQYRESHGGEVASKMFRSQFEGKTASDQLTIGKDIRNITGATISSRAIAGGVKSLAQLYQYLRKEGILGE